MVDGKTHTRSRHYNISLDITFVIGGCLSRPPTFTNNLIRILRSRHACGSAANLGEDDMKFFFLSQWQGRLPVDLCHVICLSRG